MRIWLIECGEPLPIDDVPGRLWRIGMLAEHLWHRGHDVTWWAGAFDHAHKCYRDGVPGVIEYKPRYRFRLLQGRPYARNVSVARLRNHRDIASDFIRLAQTVERPHAVVCCVPTLELAHAAMQYTSRESVPLILDYRDLWPDVFMEPFPALIRPVARIAARRWYRMAREAFSSADGITGITDEFVAKALQFTDRQFDRSRDAAFPHGYSLVAMDQERRRRAFLFWKDRGLLLDGSEFIVCYFGQLSRRLELELPIRVIRGMSSEGYPIKLVLCGKGEAESKLKSTAQGDSSILFPGFVGGEEIQVLMQNSRLGLLPYPSAADFMLSVPNKIIEYIAGGLPVISCVRGVVERLLSDECVGITYVNEDASSLRQAILKYIQNPAAQTSNASNSRKLFKARFSADVVYSKMADHIESIIDRRSVIRTSD